MEGLRTGDSCCDFVCCCHRTFVRNLMWAKLQSAFASWILSASVSSFHVCIADCSSPPAFASFVQWDVAGKGLYVFKKTGDSYEGPLGKPLLGLRTGARDLDRLL